MLSLKYIITSPNDWATPRAGGFSDLVILEQICRVNMYICLLCGSAPKWLSQKILQPGGWLCHLERWWKKLITGLIGKAIWVPGPWVLGTRLKGKWPWKRFPCNFFWKILVHTYSVTPIISHRIWAPFHTKVPIESRYQGHVEKLPTSLYYTAM